jgi:N-acetylglucosaminyldiphosphoundecaprenol N-acetyl-beta-D-mannosaminyltransferase
MLSLSKWRLIIVKLKIIGTAVDVTSYTDVCDRLDRWIAMGESRFVVAANVHVLIAAYWQREYAQALARADLITPDGMPLVWALNLLGFPAQKRVYGPDLMLAVCDRASQEGYGIYLYGSNESTLAALADRLKQKFPQLLIAGSYAPPNFVLKDGIAQFPDLAVDLKHINQSGANIIFVGLGCPKQEFWMATAKGKLNGVAIGVGAAFDFHSLKKRQAPRWIMALGLEWLFRLIQEPRRLWQRYLCQNPLFFILFLAQLLESILFPRKG